MSHFDRTLRSQFFLTGARACPYLPGRKERKLFTSLLGPNGADLHDDLALQGFRRSQNIAYRPACTDCNACMSTRVSVGAFAPSRSQRRILARNREIVRRVRPPEATDEQYDLFRRYLAARHSDGGMTDMDAHDFAAMIEDSPVRTRVVEYRQPVPDAGSRSGDTSGELVAACLTDLLADGLSMVYSFFDPRISERSLGQFVILDHIDLAREASLEYVYLGYWVPGSSKMDYKKKFRPSEILTEQGWVETALD